MNKYILEIFPWEITENYQISALNVDIDSLIKQKNYQYWIDIILKKEKWNIIVKYFISCNNINGINFLKRFYNKLYNDDVSYNEVKKIEEKKYNTFYSVWLKNISYFVTTKPSISNYNDYNSSNRIFEEIINNYWEIIQEWEEIRIHFSFKWTTWISQIMRNSIFRLMELYKSPDFIFHLNATINDKLSYFLWDIIIAGKMNNKQNDKRLWEIIEKNFSTYDSLYNNFYIKHSKSWVKIFYNKLYYKYQSDILLSNSLIIPPKENNYIKRNKIKILKIDENLINNNLILNKKEDTKIWEFDIKIWKVYSDNIINEDKLKFLKFDDNLLANKAWIILWKSWKWKSRLLAPLISQRALKSIIEYFDKNNHNNSTWSNITNYGDCIIVIDPHGGFLNDCSKIIKTFLDKNNMSGYKESIYEIQNLFINPLFSKRLLDIKENELERIINLYTNAILNWIKNNYKEEQFWANNIMFTSIFIKYFLLVNLERYKKFLTIYNSHQHWEILSDEKKDEEWEYSKMNWLEKIADFILHILEEWELPKEEIENIKLLLNSDSDFIKKIWEKILRKFKYFITLAKKEKNLFTSTINKLEIYDNDTFKTKSFLNTTLNLDDLFLSNNDYVSLVWINTNNANLETKKAITWMIWGFSYIFWTLKDYKNKTKVIWEHYIYIDEVWSLLSENFNENLNKILAECRKFKLNYSGLVFQTINQWSVKELFNNIWYIACFGISNSQEEYLLNDFNSGTLTTKISTNWLVNQERWSFTLLQFLNSWNSTISVKWFDYEDPKDLEVILKYQKDL